MAEKKLKKGAKKLKNISKTPRKSSKKYAKRRLFSIFDADFAGFAGTEEIFRHGLTQIYMVFKPSKSKKFLTRINTDFARLGVLYESCFLSKLSRRIRNRPPNPENTGFFF